MCRNIKPLFNFDPVATDDELEAAAAQYVRKISGFNQPSQANADVFNQAISEIAISSRKLIESLKTSASTKNREVEAAKAKAKSQARFS